jgi:hypothetical protein
VAGSSKLKELTMTNGFPRDGLLELSVACPNGAATTRSSRLTLSQTPRGIVTGDHELVVTIPAAPVGALANGDTLTYRLESYVNDADSSPVVLNSWVQTGAGGAGAAAQNIRMRLPLRIEGQIALAVINSGAGNASALVARMELQVGSL